MVTPVRGCQRSCSQNPSGVVRMLVAGLPNAWMNMSGRACTKSARDGKR